MKQESEEEKKARARKVSVAEGCTYSFMDGFGLRYITPYAVSMGVGTTVIGLLGAVPSLLGNLLQLSTLKLIGKKYSRKKVVFFGVLLQALMWLPLLSVGILYYFNLIGTFSASILLLITYTLMSVFGAISGPAWSSWMKDIVPKNSGSYMARRSSIASALALMCMLAAGWILDYYRTRNIFLGFTILFFVAFLGRLLGAFMFTKQYEPKFNYNEEKYFTFLQFVKKMRYNNFGRFVLMLAIMNFGVAVASPFFGVYMLKDLGFENNYISYTIVSMSSIISGLLFMPLWGKITDRYGNIKVLKVNGLLIAIIPLYWAFAAYLAVHSPSSVVPFLFICEIFNGFVWAGFNLAAGMFVYDAVTRERLALCVTYNGIVGAIAGLFGMLLGAFVAKQDVLAAYFGLRPLVVVLLISAILRFAAIFIMSRNVKEVRKVEEFNMKTSVLLKYVDPRYIFNLGIRRFGFESTVDEST